MDIAADVVKDNNDYDVDSFSLSNSLATQYYLIEDPPVNLKRSLY